MKTTFIFVNDFHCNSTVGLCPPSVTLDDGGTHQFSRTQHWLYRNWVDFTDRIKKLHRKTKKVLILNGDLGNLAKNGRLDQLISTVPSTALRITNELLGPPMKRVDHAYVIKGTPAHTGLQAWLEEAVAANYKDVVVPSGKDIYSHRWLNLEHDGVRMNIAHHGSMGRVPWTKKHAGIKLADKTLHKYAVRQEKPPNLVIRAHMHQDSDSGDAYPHIRGIFCRAWQLLPFYMDKTDPDDLADIGAMFIHIDKGEYEVEKIKYEPARTPWQKLPEKN